MSSILTYLVKIIAIIHNHIMTLNDANEIVLSDKQLHFLVIGVLGMGMFFVLYPIVKYLVEKKMIIFLSWIYVFSAIIVITFSIEIGQKVTHTGNMEFADIAYGVLGFLSLFAIFLAIRGLYHLIKMLIKKVKENHQSAVVG